MNYQNFDLEIISTQGGERLFARVLESPQGDCPFTDVKWPFQAKEESEMLADIYGTLRQRGARSSKVNTLQDFGGKLFDAVFAGDIEHLFRSSLDSAFRAGKGLRVRLRLPEDSDLHARPWEYLFDTESREFLAVREHTPLVRYLPVAQPIAPITVEGPLRILVALSAPTDHPRLDISREWDILWYALEPSINAGHIELRRVPGRCSFDNLRDSLRNFGADIFHFVGHGVPGALVLEDDAGKGMEMEATHLRSAFRSGALPRLIVLNACSGAMTEDAPFSGLAQGFLRQGVPAVVAMQASITDDAAVIFTRYFYRDLVETGAVDAALTEARLRMQGNGHPVEWGTPVLYMRALSGQLFQPRVKQDDHKRHREGQAWDNPAGERETGDAYARAQPGRERQGWEQQSWDARSRDQEAREQRERDDQAREREAREQKAGEQRAREQRAREQRAREQTAREQRAREQEAREQEARESREQQIREEQAREEEARERQAREQEAKAQQAREQQARQQQIREQQAREQQAREQRASEQLARARQARENPPAEPRSTDRRPPRTSPPREDVSVQSAAAGNEQRAPLDPRPWDGTPQPAPNPGERKRTRQTHAREAAPPPRMEPNLDEQDFPAAAQDEDLVSRIDGPDDDVRTKPPANRAAAHGSSRATGDGRGRLPGYLITLGLALVVLMLTFGAYKLLGSRSTPPPAKVVTTPAPVTAPAAAAPAVAGKTPTPVLPDMDKVARAQSGPDTPARDHPASPGKATEKSIKGAKSATGRANALQKRQPIDTPPKPRPPSDKCKGSDVPNSIDCWFPDRGGLP